VEVEPRLLDLMAEDKRLCPHLHLPLQSGCDKVLKDMRRPYDTKKFAMLLEQIRKKVPGVAVTTDVIVGFPGETEADFSATCHFVKQCGFAKMHIFPYSKRKGTPAAARQDQIPENMKKQRAEKLAELDREMQHAYFVENIGKAHTVLVEQVISDTTAGSGADNSEALSVEGLTENYIRVELPGNDALCGKVVHVKITEALIDKCKGGIL
jgi:threonylcarbamoyladenosine tRNA methylthiotransferase MtaB